MSYEDDLVRRMAAESGGGGSDRRGHVVKMAGSGGLMLLCFSLFAFGLLGGKGAALRERGTQTKTMSRTEAAKKLAAVTGPEVAALLLGSTSGVYFLFLLLRLRRFD